MLKVGSHLPLEIERLSLGGEGVGHAGPLVVFVPYAAPGDKLEVEITETRPRFARARPLQVLRASPDRTAPPCPYHFQMEPLPLQKGGGEGFANDHSSRGAQNPPRSPFTKGRSLYCGGCSWQHLLYDAQLKAKRQLVQETLERIGGIRGVTVQPVLGMKDPWRYRNKVQQPVGWDGHRLISGFYAPFSHEIVPIEDCLVQSEIAVAILNKAKSLLEQFRLRAYDDARHQGWIRHLLIRTAQGKALLVFVTRTPDFPHEREIVHALAGQFPQLTGIHQNVNPGRTNVILGRHWRKITGADFIEEQLGPLRFRLSPGSFFQVNTAQTELLYDAVKNMAAPGLPTGQAGLPIGQAGLPAGRQGERLLDLYCGVGGIALWLAGQFSEVGGIDEVASAIQDAQGNAELNGMDNVRFENISAEQFLRGIDRRAGGRSLTVILDPPRAGCAPDVLKSLVALRPGTLVYVSCDPGTLARDVAFLTKAGYRVQEVRPVDLFPHTPHIETVMKLTA